MARDLVVFGLSFAVLAASILLSVLVYNFVKSNKKKSARRKADDTGASSSSATSTGSDTYDVFLSFSGKDTRKTIADHLYNGLVDAGLHVFRDDNELREGEKIGPNLVQAIKNSKISIPILSPNYASSKWCLQELVQMTECMKSVGQVVLPIFYRVEPAHVRHQIESFGKTFSRLSRKYLEEDVAKWKQALQEVASLKGWESERTADGHEGELVKRVVRKVLIELKKAFWLVVPEQLVGIDNAAEDILRLLDDNPSAMLDDNPSATQIVGIHGMGGIGKTTLAKVVYNKLLDQFQYCSFIADIQESTQRKGISCLQSQLIFDILKMKDQVSNTDEGIRIMESRFKCKKVLLLLDNVDDNDQIKALVGKYDWFGMGSKIIITTRKRSVLDKAGVKCKYELKEIAKDKSLILFSRHAFLRDSPPCEFESLSRAIVSTAGGLPLALEVVGSFLYGQRNRGFWEDALKKLEEAPHIDVQKKLRISYDALNYEEKQIFLDIACFFNEFGLKFVSYVWEACNFLPNMGIETLCLMSLVKIDDNGDLRMHDQLRDLGKEIVRQEDCNTPMNRSRVWTHEDALEVLQRNKGKEKDRVQALFDKNCSRMELTAEQFETLPNLRILLVDNATLIGDSKGLLPKLRSLMLRGGCQASMLSSIHLEKLVHLSLGEGDISEHWEGWSHLKVANQLKVLGLGNCHCLKVSPDLSAFQNLLMLSLKGCDNLEQIHSSVGEAKGLLHLNLFGCKKLQKLPQEMGNLEELKYLDISNTAIEEIPPCIGSLNKLEKLVAFNCKSLVGLPDSISHLVNLSLLVLSGCSELCRLPECIGSLVKLQYLSLEGVGIPKDPQLDHALFHIPDSIGKLEQLTELNLSRSSICELPESIGDLKNLKILKIAYCEKLSSLPTTTSKLGSLEELDASECKCLGGEIHIDGLSSLKILRLSSTRISGFHDEFDKLSRLEELNLFKCKMLQSLPQSIGKLPSLQHLELGLCNKLQSLPELPTCLTFLAVTCQHRTLPQLSHLIHLKKLFVVGCRLLESIPELPFGIVVFMVKRCNKLIELPSLSNLEFLSTLIIDLCSELVEIKDLEALKNLAVLAICRCGKFSLQRVGIPENPQLDHALSHIPNSIGKLERLTTLDLSRSGICGLPESIGDLKSLKNLRIAYCEKLSSLPSTTSLLGSLEELDATECKCLGGEIHIDGLSSLKILRLSSTGVSGFLDEFDMLSRLEELNLSNCKKLQLLPQSIGKLPSLQRLDLAWCDKLQSLPELPTCLTYLAVTCQHGTLPQLSHLIHLETLAVVGCRLLESIPELPSGILEFFVKGCDELIELPSLSNLEFLSKLTIDSCSELAEIKDLEALKNLAELSISRCGKFSLQGVGIPENPQLDHALSHIPNSIGKLECLTKLDLSRSGICGLPESIGDLKNLKILRIAYCEKLSSLPSTTSLLGSLEELDATECKCLGGEIHIDGLSSLKILRLSSTGVSGFRDEFDKLSRLEELNLFKCKMLQSLPQSIGKLPSLQELDLEWCDKLQSLPELPTCLTYLAVTCQHGTLPQLSHLIHLETLAVVGCRLLESIPELPSGILEFFVKGCDELIELPSLSNLEFLSKLTIDSCSELAEIKDLEALKNLAELSISRCGKFSLQGVGIPENPQLDHALSHIPNSIGKLECLTKLDLSRSGICGLPESIGDLKNLKILRIAYCEKLSSLPSTTSLLGSLEELDATECKCLGGEIHIDGLSSLKILRLSSTGVSGFPDEFDKLSRLEELNLFKCKMLQSLPQSIGKLPSLQELDLEWCDKLQSLPELPTCLTYLAVTCQHGTLPQLSHLIHLETLAVVGCRLLESIPELPSGILEFFVKGCDELTELPSLSNLEFLSKLTIDSCSKLAKIKDLEALKNLAELSISSCRKLSNLDGLEHLESLRSLSLSMFFRSDDALCPVEDDMVQVQGLDRLKNLEQLQVQDCQSLLRLDLSQLTDLKQLSLWECHNLVKINGLERLKDLEKLDIEDCRSIEALPNLSCFDNLKDLNIKGCWKLRDVQGLEKVANVEK